VAIALAFLVELFFKEWPTGGLKSSRDTTGSKWMVEKPEKRRS
jgi:hypothetical protein